MEETVFFNLGNAIASKRDPKELMKEAQIVKDTREPSERTEPFKVKKIIE